MPTEPKSDTGKILVQAEQSLIDRHQASGFPGMILRLSGIYGPGRGYALKRIQQGNAVIESPGNRWVNMIHREDAASAVLAALKEGSLGEIYNVTDDVPVQQKEFYGWLARESGKPVPNIVDDDPLKPVKRRVSSKRVSNRKLSQLEAFDLKYPSYQEGYPDLIQ